MDGLIRLHLFGGESSITNAPNAPKNVPWHPSSLGMGFMIKIHTIVDTILEIPRESDVAMRGWGKGSIPAIRLKELLWCEEIEELLPAFERQG